MFKAAMFDFDGTITERGRSVPSQELANALVRVAQKMPIAFCTGRQLESFIKRGLTELLREIDPELRTAFLDNLFLMAENGAVGYFYNVKTEAFEEFYRAAWPEDFAKKETIKNALQSKIEGFGEVIDMHRVVIVMRTIPHDHNNIEEISTLSNRIYEATVECFEKEFPGYKDYLHVGNSGIGVLVTPAEGDKDAAIKRFAKFLEEKREVKFSAECREILVVGDQPLFGGNDYYFLNGKYGTPFTVGEYDPSREAPAPVLSAKGKRLFNDQGTLFLLESILKAGQ